MKIGSVVMFMNLSNTHAKWFYGQIAIVESISELGTHCRVKWLQPVLYFDKVITMNTPSCFAIHNFEVFNESR